MQGRFLTRLDNDINKVSIHSSVYAARELSTGSKTAFELLSKSNLIRHPREGYYFGPGFQAPGFKPETREKSNKQ
jgi:hypothetical protein